MLSILRRTTALAAPETGTGIAAVTQKIAAAKDKAAKSVSAVGNETTERAVMFAHAVDAKFGANVEEYLKAKEVIDAGPIATALDLDRNFSTPKPNSNVPALADWPPPGSKQFETVDGQVVERKVFDKWEDTDLKGNKTSGAFYWAFADNTPIGLAIAATRKQIKAAQDNTDDREDKVVHPSGEVTLAEDFEGMSDSDLESELSRWDSRKTNNRNVIIRAMHLIFQMIAVANMDYVSVAPIMKDDGTPTKAHKNIRLTSKKPGEEGVSRAITMAQFLRLNVTAAEDMEHGGTLAELLKTGRAERDPNKGQGGTNKEPDAIVKLDESWGYLQMLAQYYDNDTSEGVKHQDMLLEQLRKDMKNGAITDNMKTVYNIGRALDAAYTLVEPRCRTLAKVDKANNKTGTNG